MWVVVVQLVWGLLVLPHRRRRRHRFPLPHFRLGWVCGMDARSKREICVSFTMKRLISALLLSSKRCPMVVQISQSVTKPTPSTIIQLVDHRKRHTYRRKYFPAPPPPNCFPEPRYATCWIGCCCSSSSSSLDSSSSSDSWGRMALLPNCLPG